MLRFGGEECAVLPLLREHFAIRNVLDVGCGSGAWLAVWQELGAELLGLDGDSVGPASQAIPAARFIAHDLHQPIDLGRSFDLVAWVTRLMQSRKYATVRKLPSPR